MFIIPVLKFVGQQAMNYVIGAAAEFTGSAFYDTIQYLNDYRKSVKQGHPGILETEPGSSKEGTYQKLTLKEQKGGEDEQETKA